MMATTLIVAVTSAAIALLAGWALPAWAMRRLMPAFDAFGKRVTNYRGRAIPVVLGLVWLVWAAAVSAIVGFVSFGTSLVSSSLVIAGSVPPPWWDAVRFAPLNVAAAGLPLLLVVGAMGFGLIDDLFGGRDARGFRGHISALLHGRLTTGMLKLLGIGGLAAASGVRIAASAVRGAAGFTAASGWRYASLTLLAWVCATAVIALAANLVNLTDLRPGRALKSYIGLAVVGAGMAMWAISGAYDTQVATALSAAGPAGSPAATVGGMVWSACTGVSLIALLFGPVGAIWRYDLGERAMLGDAGANAMGALAGYQIAVNAPLWFLIVAALVLLALNLASERISFTKVIERTRPLRWLDGLGRVAIDGVADTSAATGIDEGDTSARAGGPAAARCEARKDGGS